jgi:hypothetical protein
MWERKRETLTKKVLKPHVGFRTLIPAGWQHFPKQSHHAFHPGVNQTGFPDPFHKLLNFITIPVFLQPSCKEFLKPTPTTCLKFGHVLTLSVPQSTFIGEMFFLSENEK